MSVINVTGNSISSDVVSTTTHTRPPEPASSQITRDLDKVKQSAVEFKKGHKRSNAVDFRVEKVIDFINTANPVSLSAPGCRPGLETVPE